MSVVVALALTAVIAVRGAGGATRYGAPVGAGGAEVVELANIFADTTSYNGRRVVVSGRVGQVCQTSGCWITLTDGANQLFVQFYDFTVKVRPGARVRVQGTVRVINSAPYLVGEGLEVNG
jgi:hypothetical protein